MAKTCHKASSLKSYFYNLGVLYNGRKIMLRSKAIDNNSKI